MVEIVDVQARTDIKVLSVNLENHIKGCEEGNRRMDKKLDDISDAIKAQGVRSKDRSDALFNKFDTVEERVRLVEQTPENTDKIKNWVLGGLVTGLVAVIGYLLKYGTPG